MKKSIELKRNTSLFPADKNVKILLTAKTYRSHINVMFEMQLCLWLHFIFDDSCHQLQVLNFSNEEVLFRFPIFRRCFQQFFLSFEDPIVKCTGA